MLFNYKCRRATIILSLVMITISIVSKNTEAARDRGVRCEKPDYIPNGSYRIRRDRVMRINCNSGFVLQGSKVIECIRGKWDGEKPVCAKKGCKNDLLQPENGRVQIENDVKAILYCSDGYNLAGNRHSYCNGTIWDRPIGTCRERKNVVQHGCDFETDDICGWTYEPREGLEWKRVMAADVFTSFKTGPRHDHTTLTANGGHYMLMESLTRQNDDVTLTSPIYDLNMSLKTACCFQFYYFMYGAGVGDLFVVVRPVSLDLDDLLKNHKELIKFQKYGNQNNIWNEAHFNIEELHEDFQILFVAKSGRGQLSDIAIDDVKLLTGEDCRSLDSKDEENVSKEEYYSTTYESIFEMQSCAGHCFESPGSGLIRTHDHLRGLCNCDIDCEDNETCCPDFRTVCLNELFSQSTSILETDEATKINEAHKNESTTSRATIKSSETTTTKKTASTTVGSTPTTTKAPTTTKTPPTTTKTTQSTTKTTPTTTSITTSNALNKTTTTLKATNRRTIPTTTMTSKTTPRTILKTTATPTTRNTTPTTTTRKATPTTSSRNATLLTTTHRIETKTTKKSSTTLKTTTSSAHTPSTTTRAFKTTTISTDLAFPPRPLPASRPIEYTMNDKSKSEPSSKGYSSLLLYTFFIILALILAGSAYKRFGDRAVAWYMVRFKKNTTGDDDAPSITTSLKRTQAKSTGANGNLKATWRNKIKSTNTKNIMKTPLVCEDEEDDDDDIGANGNIALKNNIYTEL